MLGQYLFVSGMDPTLLVVGVDGDRHEHVLQVMSARIQVICYTFYHVLQAFCLGP